MKKKSPISLNKIFFSDISLSASTAQGFLLSDIIFDKRHDFLLEKDFGGIAVKLHIENLRFSASKGVRRKVSAALYDVTDRILLTTQQINVHIPGFKCVEHYFLPFPAAGIEFKSGHAYRLQVRDDNADVLLGEKCFRVYGISQLGDPGHWFKPIAGGLIREGESDMLKSCNIASEGEQTYHIRFEVSRQLANKLDVLPELEIRLFYPYKECVKAKFTEPRYAYRSDSTYIVEDKIHFSGGYNGIWYAELLCLEIPIAGFCFSVDEKIAGCWTDANLAPVEEYDYSAVCRRYNENFADESSEDSQEYYDSLKAEDFDGLLDDFIAANTDPEDNDDNADNSENNDNPLYELNDLTGLSSVKEKVMAYNKLMCFAKRRSYYGLETFPTTLHSMFLGSPGTGKTTVAKLMGAMLKKTGVLSSGHVVECERSTLIGKYYNSEAEKTLEAIEKAQGGILFIDEAHSLFQPHDPKDPGKFVIEALLTALADPEKDDWMLILAGYADGMKKLFDLNPGFKSRIPESNIYTFEDFSVEQLMEIAERRLEKLEFKLTPEAKEALRLRLAADYANCDEKFGNARHVMNLIHTEIIPSVAIRVMDAGPTDPDILSTIHPSDIPMPTPKPQPRHAPVGFHFSTAS